VLIAVIWILDKQMQDIDNKDKHENVGKEAIDEKAPHETEATETKEKPKKQLTEAQRLAFLKGREKRMANLEIRRQEKEEAMKAGLMSPPPPVKRKPAPAVTMDDSYADIIAQRVIDKLSSIKMPTPSPSPPRAPAPAPEPEAKPTKRPYVRKVKIEPEPPAKLTADEPTVIKTPERRRAFGGVSNFSWA
jgi:hypothetical protein